MWPEAGRIFESGTEHDLVELRGNLVSNAKIGVNGQDEGAGEPGGTSNTSFQRKELTHLVVLLIRISRVDGDRHLLELGNELHEILFLRSVGSLLSKRPSLSPIPRQPTVLT